MKTNAYNAKTTMLLCYRVNSCFGNSTDSFS